MRSISQSCHSYGARLAMRGMRLAALGRTLGRMLGPWLGRLPAVYAAVKIAQR